MESFRYRFTSTLYIGGSLFGVYELIMWFEHKPLFNHSIGLIAIFIGVIYQLITLRKEPSKPVRRYSERSIEAQGWVYDGDNPSKDKEECNVIWDTDTDYYNHPTNYRK